MLTAIGLSPGGSSTVHIYTQTIHRTTQFTTLVGRLSGIRTQSGQTKINVELTAWKLSPNWEKCGPSSVFVSYTLAFALQLRKKAWKNLSQGRKNLSQVRTIINILFAGSNYRSQTNMGHCVWMYESRISSSTIQGADSQWPLGIRRGSVAAPLLALWINP